MIRLHTERLILRPFQQDDLPAYLELVGDATAMRYIGSGMTLGREAAWTQLATLLGHWQLRGYGLWAIEERGSGALVGRAGLFNPEGWPGIEVGWALIRRYWGKGYATEAATAALDWAFDALEVGEIISCIQPANHASIKVAERLGEQFSHEELLQGHKVHIYKITREIWLQNRNATP